MNHFLNLSDLGTDGLLRVLDEADRQKDHRGTIKEAPLAGKTVA